jgi:hypothetical protein
MIRLLVLGSADADRKNLHGVSPRELARTIANYDLEPLLQASNPTDVDV